MRIYLVGGRPSSSKVTKRERVELLMLMKKVLLSFALITKIVPNNLGYKETFEVLQK